MNEEQMRNLRLLHHSVDMRYPPEQVASIILRVGLDLSPTTTAALRHVARYSSDRPFFGANSFMSQDWKRVSTAAPIVASLATDVASMGWDVTPPDPMNHAKVSHYASAILTKLGGAGPYDRCDLREKGWPQRRYNRMRRTARALKRKATRMAFEADVRAFAQLGRAGMATQLPESLWLDQPELGAFIAYIVAKRNVRRTFSLSGKQSIHDEVVEGIFNDLKQRTDVSWTDLALVWPTTEVMHFLTPFDVGVVVARWFAVMNRAATRLAMLAETFLINGHPLDYDEYIVVAGQDSDTWNLAAQAFNEARAGWIAALDTIDMTGLLESFCPGKVMRLMAGDLARWGRREGTWPHRDTLVARLLPAPWEVVRGNGSCTADQVRAAVGHAEIQLTDAHRIEKISGWVTPRPNASQAAFEPTPELVHGIIITDPLFAQLLRHAGAFSGKAVNIELLDQAFAFARDDFSRLIHTPRA